MALAAAQIRVTERADIGARVALATARTHATERTGHSATAPAGPRRAPVAAPAHLGAPVQRGVRGVRGVRGGSRCSVTSVSRPSASVAVMYVQ